MRGQRVEPQHVGLGPRWAGIGAAFAAAAAQLGRAGRAAVRISADRREADRANIISPFLIVGGRRFMPPVPPSPEGRRMAWTATSKSR
jgi:hypothetical protein